MSVHSIYTDAQKISISMPQVKERMNCTPLASVRVRSESISTEASQMKRARSGTKNTGTTREETEEIGDRMPKDLRYSIIPPISRLKPKFYILVTLIVKYSTYNRC